MNKTCLLDELKTRWQECRAFVDDKSHPNTRIKFRMSYEAATGDASFTRGLAGSIAESIIRKKELDPIEIVWLSSLLLNIEKSSHAAQAVSGETKRGAPKKGGKSLTIAAAVVRAVMDDGATSLDSAWQMVAEQYSVDSRTVRKYWASWRPTLDGSFECHCSDGPHAAHDLNYAIKSMIRTNKGCESTIKNPGD